MPPPPYLPTPPPTAAAPESQSPLVGEGKPIKVLVTGFGPWDRHGINPSHEIVSRLPTSLTLSSGRKVELGIKTPLPVASNFVHNHLPALLDEYQPDLVLHVGLAGGRKYYAPELSAPRNGFLYADIEGRTWSKEMGETAVPGQIPTPISTTKPPNHHGESDTPLWPKTLRTSLEYGTVVGKWKAKNEGLGIESRESDDVGGFMCGFSYYTSLAWFRSKSLVSAENQELEKDVAEGGPVLFLHVPETSKEEEWAKGRQVTINLIETMVEVWLRQK